MRNRTRTRPCYFLLLGGGSRTMPKASSERSGLLINQNACMLAMAIAVKMQPSRLVWSILDVACRITGNAGAQIKAVINFQSMGC